MPAWKDIGHPLGWLAYSHSNLGLSPRWVGKRKTHNVRYNSIGNPNPYTLEKLKQPGPPRALYSLSNLSNKWFGYMDPAKPWDDKSQTFDYIAWCMFWSVPVVELSRKMLDRTITHVEEDQLREYLGKIPAHPPIATGHRQPADSE